MEKIKVRKEAKFEIGDKAFTLKQLAGTRMMKVIALNERIVKLSKEQEEKEELTDEDIEKMTSLNHRKVQLLLNEDVSREWFEDNITRDVLLGITLIQSSLDKEDEVMGKVEALLQDLL